MSIFRDRIIDGLANMILEAGAKAVENISPPAESRATYVEVESSPQPPPRRSLPPAPPAQRAVPKPAQTGARPNENLPPFPFPAPMELPPVESAQPALPSSPPPGPRRRGRPRKNGENARPQLFMNGRGTQALPPANPRTNGDERERD